MALNTPPPPALPPKPSPPSSPPRRSRWLLYGCGGFLLLVLLLIATVAITIWWIQRPIKPVVLSPAEKARVESKLRTLEQSNSPATTTPAQTKGPPAVPPVPNHGPDLVETPPVLPPPGANQERDQPYVPGSKVLKLTQREINGLLNENTELGKSVRLEFAKDAINAYLAVPIPKDFPIGGGRMFRARGRFRLSIGNGGAPYAILEDVTVFGLSLPQAWLGGLKGENLLGDAIGEHNGSPILRGIKSLRVEPGALVIEVND